MAATVYSRAVQKAAELLGGREELAKALQVPASEIEKWIAEQSKPPREIFLRVVDIILDETPAGAAADDAPDAPPGRDAAGPTRYVD